MLTADHPEHRTTAEQIPDRGRTRTGCGAFFALCFSLRLAPQEMVSWRPTPHAAAVSPCNRTRSGESNVRQLALSGCVGLKNALDYLVWEKLLIFAEAAEQHPEFAAELPRFQAAVWELLHPYELAGYLASLRPMTRKKLQKLL